MGKIFIPDDYTPALDLKETQIAIKKVKDFFQERAASGLEPPQSDGAAVCGAGVRPQR